MAWESRENALTALLSPRSFGGRTGQRAFPGCSKQARASWTDCCTGELDAPTFFPAVPATHSRLVQAREPALTCAGGRPSTAVPMAPDEDIPFQERHHLSWFALSPAALLVTLLRATFVRRFDPGYGSRLEVAIPRWRTIGPLVLLHRT